jgi:putative acetyltransferase
MEFRIRPVRETDAEDINALRTLPGVYENNLALPAERVEFCQEYIDGLLRNDHQYVAVVQEEGGERIIGTAGLSVMRNPRLYHSASFGIMVHPDYQNCGVGTALMKAILDLADNWLMLVRIELTVFCDNERAIHLYEKMGFEIEGKKRMAAIRHGKYADEYLMARIRPGFAQ